MDGNVRIRGAIATAWRACGSDGETIVSRLLLIALGGLAVFAALRSYPHAVPPAAEHPDYVDTVLESRALVLAGRMTLLFAAGFAVLSIAARMWNKEWLSKAGPFEVSQVATSFERERELVADELAETRARIEDVSAALEEAMRSFDILARGVLTSSDEERGATDGSR